MTWISPDLKVMNRISLILMINMNLNEITITTHIPFNYAVTMTE